ncbi:MAG: DapH/DapD/GlmU-related protein, partial [Pseudomonadota bacterium]
DLEPWESKIMLYPHQVEWSADHSITKKADGIPHPLEPTEPLREECRHFLECVASNATPRTDGHEGLRVLRVLDKASRSLAPGQGNRGTALKVGPEPSSPRVYGAHDGVQIHETAYVDADVTIGEGTKIWHFSHILSDVEIGTQCNFGQNVVVGPRVRIGNTVKVQNNVSIYEGVTIEDGVFCGPSCVFTNVNNPRSEIARKSEYAETLVKRGATIGANATIVCGHTLGEYAFIAAGAVVASDVPDYALMAGVPARRIGWMSKAGARLGADLVCPLDGTKYQENGDGALVSS